MIDSLIDNPKLAIAILFSIIGLILVLIALYYTIKARESNSWTSTDGIILSSDVIKDINSSTNNGFSVTYKPEICYSYKVDNDKFVSNRIRIIFNYFNGSSARSYRLTNKYPKNSKVTVYYNPNKPDDSVLEPGLKSDIIVFLIIGIVISIIALIFANNFGLTELIK